MVEAKKVYQQSSSLYLTLSLCLSGLASAQTLELKPVEVTSQYDWVKKSSIQASPAYSIEKKQLQDSGLTDTNRVLKTQNGVNVQEEDGWGLRPNIGIRGTPPHRSRKVSFYEDGVLIGPAPYSAPAAYYVPSLHRTESLEIQKGLNSVFWGPNNVAGSLMYKSLGFREDILGKTELLYGAFGSERYRGQVHLHDLGSMKALFAAEHFTSDGFKTIENRSDLPTGFTKNDVLIKLMLPRGDTAWWTLKLGYEDELSYETYLGLSLSDFAEAPYRRYMSTQNDRMKWEHKTVQVTYSKLLSGAQWEFNLYHHDFDRTWYRLDRLTGGGTLPSLYDTLINPQAHSQYLQLLRGQVTSAGLGGVRIAQAINDRAFLNQGIQALWSQDGLSIGSGTFRQQALLRLHYDEIRRRHRFQDFEVDGPQQISPFGNEYPGVQNHDSAWAATGAWKGILETGAWLFEAQLRLEDVSYRSRSSSTDKSRRDQVVVPGVGALYNWNSTWQSYASLNHGVTLVGPQGGETDVPERAWTWEARSRYISPDQKQVAEVTGFILDYQNIQGICTLATGCYQDNLLDQSFRGGKARTLGVETRWLYEYDSGAWLLPTQIAVTWLDSRFMETFLSTNPEWGQGVIQAGEPLPYVPSWIASLQAGVLRGRWSWQWQGQYTSAQWDSSANTGNRLFVPHYTVWDTWIQWRPAKAHTLSLRVDNVLGSEYLVSYRPFCARPGKPQMWQLSWAWMF